MKFLKFTLLLVAIASLTGCASGYDSITPKSLNYASVNVKDGVKLEYKYDLLDKKYEKKEDKRGVKLVAVSITNTSERDLIFGKDLTLSYENGDYVPLMEYDKTFKSLRQSPLTHLFYLLLTPLNLHITKASSSGNIVTNSYPIGLLLGPGIAGGNMIAASTANGKFKKDLMEYNLQGTMIKKGETKYGLIGINTDSYDALQPVVKNASEAETKKEIAP
ncbi:hypothetical protein SAMN04488034_105121 [Salinimicrobium catena]|uniref:Lipoprotein n=1 Tax=Salinimicrobium catena TaxID=390640 RepID=A0A1H5NTY8_9FLAO|nr:hypothetical protein [Salinimicrobium catena]SDL53312.1 hypothetical protein SAMN04488140_10540 [Salinimicrobium catena]SEF04291.1 hypothetical protein SAMN04488034_105121 [Salinimicrobium catena]